MKTESSPRLQASASFTPAIARAQPSDVGAPPSQPVNNPSRPPIVTTTPAQAPSGPATRSTTCSTTSGLSAFSRQQRATQQERYISTTSVGIPLTFQWPVKFRIVSSLITYILSLLTVNVSQVDRLTFLPLFPYSNSAY